MTRPYDNIIKIDDAWTGPKRLSGRALVFGGEGYDEILGELVGEIVRTSRQGSTRSSLSFVILNLKIGGKLVSQHSLDDRLEGRRVELLEIDRDTQASQQLFVGIIRKREFGEQGVVIEAVEDSIHRSRRIGASPVQKQTFPRARPSDIGSVIPLPIGTVKNALLPQIEFNPFSVLANDLTASDLNVFIDDVTDFPASGIIRIDDEKMSYASIDAVNKQFLGLARGALGTKAIGHLQGSTVISVDEFVIAVDQSNRPSNVVAAFAVGRDEKKVELPLPAMDNRSGARVAVWPETPLYDQPNGESEVIEVGLDSDNGTDPVLGVTNALSAAPDFSPQGFAALLFSNTSNLRGLRVEPPIPRGRVKKVILEVLHTGDKTDFVSGLGFDTVVGGASVLLNGSTIGPLSNQSNIDAEFKKVGGRLESFQPAALGQTPGPVVVSNQRIEFGDVVLNTIASPATTNLVSTGLGADKNSMIDGDDNTYSVFWDAFSGPTTNELNFVGVSIPGVPQTAQVTRIKFKFLHGGPPNETVINSLLGGGTAIMEIREGLLLVSGQQPAGVFGSLVLHQIDSGNAFSPPVIGEDATFKSWLENGGSGRTIADLSNLRFLITEFDKGVWQIRSVYIEVDYNYTTVQESENPVTNHFDVTNILQDWSDIAGASIDLVAGATTILRVYRFGFQVIYDPIIKRPANKVVLDIDADIQGTPAQIIQELWTDPELGNNPLSSIDAAAFAAASARLTAEGYVSSTIGCLVRRREAWSFIQDFSRQVRLLAFIEFGILKVSYQELSASIPIPTKAVTKDNITSEPRFVGSDIERDIINKVEARFFKTDLNDYEGSRSRNDAASIASYSEFGKTLNLDCLLDSAVVDKTIDLLFDRSAEPFEVVTFVLARDYGRVSLLDFLSVDLDWYSANVFEVETIKEAFSDTFSVQGRILR